MFISYISNRKQCVMINGVQSDTENIRYGVPQGSVLGPILFLISRNDLICNVTDVKTLLYADDPTFYIVAVIQMYLRHNPVE